MVVTARIQAPNGLTLSRANRTRDRSTYDDEAAVGVGCSVELERSCHEEMIQSYRTKGARSTLYSLNAARDLFVHSGPFSQMAPH